MGLLPLICPRCGHSIFPTAQMPWSPFCYTLARLGWKRCPLRTSMGGVNMVFPSDATFPVMRSLKLSSLSWNHISFRLLFATFPNVSHLDITSDIVKPACDGARILHPSTNHQYPYLLPSLCKLTVRRKTLYNGHENTQGVHELVRVMSGKTLAIRTPSLDPANAVEFGDGAPREGVVEFDILPDTQSLLRLAFES